MSTSAVSNAGSTTQQTSTTTDAFANLDMAEFLNLFIYNVNLYGFGIALDPIQRIRYRMGREGMIVSSDLSRSRENDDGKFGTIGEKGGSFARFFNALEHVFDGC